MRAVHGKDTDTAADKWIGRPQSARGLCMIKPIIVVIAIGIMLGNALKTLFPLMGKSERGTRCV